MEARHVQAPIREFVGKTPTDQEKMGAKCNLPNRGQGVPIVNRRDRGQLPRRQTVNRGALEAIVIERLLVIKEAPQHLCADAGYMGKQVQHKRLRHEAITSCPLASRGRQCQGEVSRTTVHVAGS